MVNLARNGQLRDAQPTADETKAKAKARAGLATEGAYGKLPMENCDQRPRGDFGQDLCTNQLWRRRRSGC